MQAHLAKVRYGVAVFLRGLGDEGSVAIIRLPVGETFKQPDGCRRIGEKENRP